MKPAALPSPFRQKSLREKRLKILVHGESGSGKTRFALSLPRLAMIDTEGGTDHYDGDYAIAYLHDADEVRGAIDWLARGEHEFSTLAIDSFSLVWDAFQRKWSEIFLERLGDRRSHKHEFFELGPREWMTLKADHRDLLERLLQIDMNVVLTCRTKPEYEGGSGELMRKVGTTFEGEKSLPYVFDIVLELWRVGGKTLALARKDRTGKLPGGPFEPTAELLLKTYPGLLTRKAKPLERAGREEVERIRELAGALGIGVERLEERARALGHGALDDLTPAAARELSARLERALE